jgi:hypothetical protein
MVGVPIEDNLDLRDWDIVKNKFMETYEPKYSAQTTCANFSDLIQRNDKSINDYHYHVQMGWFMHWQLNNLCDQISKVRNQQHHLLQIQQITLTHLDELEMILQELIWEAVWINYFARDHGRIQLHFHMQKLTQVLKAADQR